MGPYQFLMFWRKKWAFVSSKATFSMVKLEPHASKGSSKMVLCLGVCCMVIVRRDRSCIVFYPNRVKILSTSILNVSVKHLTTAFGSCSVAG